MFIRIKEGKALSAIRTSVVVAALAGASPARAADALPPEATPARTSSVTQSKAEPRSAALGLTETPPPIPESRGGGLMGLGTGLIGLGAGTFVLVPLIHASANPGNSSALDEGGQLAVSISGAVVIAGGATLVTLGLMRRIESSKARRKWRRQYGMLMPVVGPEHAGLAWTGRF